MTPVIFTIRRNENQLFDITTNHSIYNENNKYDVPFLMITAECNSITHWCKNTSGVEPEQAMFIFE